MDSTIEDDEDRRGISRKKLITFSPVVSTGVIMQILAWIILGGIAYGNYSADRRASDIRITQIEKDATDNRGQVKESLTELKGNVQKVQEALVDVKESLAVLKAQNQNPPPPRK